MKEKTKKLNRVRIGGGGPHVDQFTNNEVIRRQKSTGLSKGKVLDQAVAATTPEEFKK